MPPDPSRYTKPELREQIKRRIMAGDKGGRPGQWSARKAQMLVQEYERRGGGYRKSRSKSQKDLERWTREKWRTYTGKPALRPDGKMDRYLPDKAWRSLSRSQAQATRQKKLNERRQFVPNTQRAARARRSVSRSVSR